MTIAEMLEAAGKCDNPDDVEVKICLNGEEFVSARNAYFTHDDDGILIFAVDNREDLF